MHRCTADPSSNMAPHLKDLETTMNDTAPNPLEALLANLRDTLGDLAPEPLLNRMKPALERFLEQFQLVPKREYDAHMAKLSRSRGGGRPTGSPDRGT